MMFTKIYQVSKETGPIVVYAGLALVITVVALLAARAVPGGRSRS